MRDRHGGKIECPVCRKTDVHYSKGRSFATFVMGMLFNMDPLRCYCCQNLFYRRTAQEDETEQYPDQRPRLQSKRRR